MILSHSGMTKMKVIECRILMARKVIEIQVKVETQCKGSKILSKVIQELKDKITTLRKNQTELLELNNSLQEFYSKTKSINIRINQVEERTSELEVWFFKATQ